MNAAPQRADERCPRCGGGFHCGMNDPTPCACTGLQLDAAVQQRLRQRYTGCLCLRCLKELATAALPAGSEAATANG